MPRFADGLIKTSLIRGCYHLRAEVVKEARFVASFPFL
jgi:hypothetical protein